MTPPFDSFAGDIERRIKTLSASPLESVMKKVKLHEQVLSRLAAQADLFKITEQVVAHAGFSKVSLAATNLSKIAEQFAAQSDFSKIAEQVAAHTDFSKIAERFMGNADLSKLYATMWQPNLANTLTNLIATIREEQFDDFHIQPDGSVVVDGEAVGSEEIQEVVTELVNQPESFLINLGERLISKPLRFIVALFLEQKMTLLFLLLTVYQIVQAHYSDHNRDIQFHELQQEQRSQRQTGKETLDALLETRDIIKEMADSRQHPVEYRVVSSPPLEVRSQPTDEAHAIGTLSTGTVVRLVEKRGQWALIEYESANPDSVKKGWILSDAYQSLTEVHEW